MSIIEIIKKIAETEVRKLHTNEIGMVTSVFPHTSEDDKDNYECNVMLRDRGLELRKVPVLTSHIGLANIPHVGDLVLLSFINADINSPVLIGRLYNDQDRPPLSNMEEIVYAPPYVKNEKLRRINIVLPEKILNLNFYDDRITLVVGKSSMDANSDGEISIRSTKNEEEGEESELLINDGSMKASVRGGSNLSAVNMTNMGYIQLQANPSDKVCEITMNAGGIDISTDSDIKIKTKSSMQIECDGNLSLTAKGDFSLNARKVAIESDMETRIQASSSMHLESTAPMSIKSDAIANIESSGPMTIKGAIVNIN